MNNDRRKLFGTILGIIIFIICVISISYAFYKWKSNNTNVNITFDDPIIDFTMGSNVNATGLTPVLDYMDASNYTTENSGKYVAYTEFTTDNQSNSNQYYKAKLDITTLDTALKTNTFKYSLLKKDTTSGEYDKLICNGNFSSFVVNVSTTGSTTSQENIICDGIEVKSSTEDYYRFVVYIDGNEENDINMMNKSLESTLVLDIDSDKNNIVTISLNNNSATSSGTTSIYQRYGVGIYKDNTASTTEMTTSTNNITIPTKTGYTFKGYYTENNGNGEQLINNNGYITNLFSVTKYKEATTLYANYNINKYYISYSLNNGKFSNTDLKPGVVIYDNIVNISNPHRDGYKFIGWTSNDIDTGVAYYGNSDSNVTTKWSSTSTKVTANYFKNLTSTNEKTVTLNANFQDITKPECTIATPTDITSGNTTTVLLTCTDNDSLASNTLSASDFTISDATIALVQSVSSATVVSSTKHQYTITIKGTSPGAYSISLNKGSIKDSAGNSNNKVTSGIANVAGTNIRDAEVTISPTSYTYDNTAKTPSVTVKFGNVTLTKDTDYTVSYLNNVNVGTATVKVTGIGSYTGIVTKEFKINKRGLTITASSQTITYGEAITQGVDKVTVATLLSGHTLTSVTLTQSTTSATTSGTIMPSAVIIKDSSGNEVTNNYSITYKTGTLVINKKEITDSMVSISPTSYIYDGTAKTPTATVTDGSTTFTKDTDYTVSYSNNINVGTATATITGTNSCTGTVSKTFTISYLSFPITLDPSIPSTITGGSSYYSNGTTTLYARYADGIYKDNSYENKMTTSANAISKPTATGYNFGGYYTGTSCSGTMMINGSGNITENFTTKVFNEATTLYACWNRTFTCTNGSEIDYAGVKWIATNDTTNSICTMVLKGRTTNSGTYDARSTNVKTALTGGSVTGVTGTFNKTTITNEANAGLITSYDVGTGGTNPSGLYWYASGKVYDSSNRTQYSASGSYTIYHGSYSSNSVKHSSGSISFNVPTGMDSRTTAISPVTSGSSTLAAGTRTVSNSSSTWAVPSGTLKSTTYAPGNSSGNRYSLYFTHYHAISVSSASNIKVGKSVRGAGTNDETPSQWRVRFYPCGGSSDYSNKLAWRFTATAKNKYTFEKVVAGTSSSYTIGSGTHPMLLMAAKAASTTSSKTNGTLRTYQHYSDSSCKTFTTYSVSSGSAMAIYYRPSIKVKY